MASCAFSCHGNCSKKQLHQCAPGKKRTPPPGLGNRSALLPPSPLRTVSVAFTVILLKLSECELHRTATNRKQKDRLVDNAEHADSITGIHVFISHLCIFFSC